MKSGCCLELGIEEYGKIFALQKRLNQARREGTIPDTVIFLEHQPCFTVGRKGGFEHILMGRDYLAQQGIRIYESDRGGDVTYHGPGQLICYPILDLNRHGRDVHIYARKMEQIMIDTLASFGICAGRREKYPGVWVDAEKIGAQGIAVQSWVTMHGVSLNICPDLRHFSYIIPCGISTLGVTSMEKILGYPLPVEMVREEMRRRFSQAFGLVLEDIGLEKAEEMVQDDG
jgi:lipoic acid synthetase/lipoyl(octanoyl) transferase